MFDKIEIPQEMAFSISSLYFDGGNDIFSQLAPIWDGEDDIFDIKAISEDELAQFPNLKTIDGTAFFMTKEVMAFLKEKDIAILIK